MKRDFLFWGGVAYLVLLVLFALIMPTARHHYLEQVGRPHLPPSAQFWLGTDEMGRDIVARLAYGASVSLRIGFTVQLLALSIGIIVGLLGVFAPRWISAPLMRLTDAMFSFPDVLLAILIVGLWTSGMIPVIVALAITAWPSVARLVFTQASSLKDREYVVASRALGAPMGYVVRRHIVPHLWGVLLAVSMVEVAGTILAESALSFIGIGIQSPLPSWGNMIANARFSMSAHPLPLLWPCLLLSLTIFALNFVGDGLRAIVDPKNR